MDDSRIRAWWSRQQGLDGGLEGKTAAQVLEQSGWARSVGGVSPYLTLFSRARIGREAADKAMAALQIHELPAARGCTYVLPAGDFALGLKVGEAFAGAELKTAAKLGVSDKEVGKLCDAVIQALEKGPLSPDDIREATGKCLAQSRRRGEEERGNHDVASGARQTAGDGRDSTRSSQRASGSAALPLHAMASKPSCRLQAVRRGSVCGTRAQVLPVDWPCHGPRFSGFCRTWSKRFEGCSRTAETCAGRERQRIHHVFRRP